MYIQSFRNLYFLLTRYCNYGENIGGDEDAKRQKKHGEQTERYVELFLPGLCVKSIGHALLEFLDERPLDNVEYDNLKMSNGKISCTYISHIHVPVQCNFLLKWINNNFALLWSIEFYFINLYISREIFFTFLCVDIYKNEEIIVNHVTINYRQFTILNSSFFFFKNFF